MPAASHIRAWVIGLVALLMAPQGAGSQALIANLSDHLVAISTGFTGTNILVYGTVDGPGEVVVVVQGPESDVAVRRKDRIAGIWVNADTITFERVPAFYAVAASADPASLAPEAVLQRHEIGLDHIRLLPRGAFPADKVAVFRAALIRNKQKLRLYPTEAQGVTVLGRRLFDVRISLPANVPTGIYTAGVFLIRDGDVVSAQTMPLNISKIGFSANVYEVAMRQSLLYALFGLTVAVALGWIAGIVFRRA